MAKRKSSQVANDPQQSAEVSQPEQGETETYQNETIQKQLLEMAVTGIIITRMSDSVVLYANAEAERMFRGKREAWIGQSSLPFYENPDDRQPIMVGLRQSGYVRDHELCLKRVDGELFWALLSVQPVQFEGESHALLTMMIDISERKQSEARQQTILGTMPVGILITEPTAEGQVRYSNQEFARMLGTTPEMTIGKPVPDLYYNPEDRAKVLKKIREQGFVRNYPVCAKRANGEPLWVELSIQPMQYEGSQVLLVALIDIAQRRGAEVEREQFALQLNTAAAIATQVSAILDPDKLLQAVIPLIKENFGLYYAHVYVLDEKTGMLNLRAGYGEPGRIMLERGHSIPLAREQSLVAMAARTKELVHVPEVTKTAAFLPNPLLSDTRTEVAVPLVAGDHVLGVFDIQHDVPNYFTQSYLDVFTTLAGQIAVALQNAQTLIEVDRQRAFYDGIITNLPVGVWAVDKQFTPLLVNPAGQHMMGREIKDKDGGAYVETYDVINVDTGELFDNTQLPLVKAITQGGVHSTRDAGVRWPDGTVVPMLINAAPLTDAEGAQTGAVVIFVDATEQRTAQEALAERVRLTEFDAEIGAALAQPQTLREILQQCAEITTESLDVALVRVWMLDKVKNALELQASAGLYTRLNGPHKRIAVNAESQIGDIALQHKPYHTTEIIGDLRASSDPQWAEKKKIGAFAGYPLQVGEQTMGVLGIFSRQPLKGGVLQALSIVANNIALGIDRKQAEIAVKASEARFRDVATNIAGWVWEVNSQGQYTYCSEKVNEVLGYSIEEMLGKTPFDFMLPEEVARIAPQFGEMASRKENIVDLMNWNLRKDGRRICLLTNGVALVDENGDLLGYRGVDTDITERALAEAEIEASTARLRSVLNALPLGMHMYRLEPDGRLVFTGANPSADKLFKVDSNTLIGKTVEEILPPRVDPEIARYYHESATLGKSQQTEQVIYDKGEIQTAYEIYLFPTAPNEMAAGFLDVTERSRARIALENFATQLSTASDIAGRVNAILDPDQLLNTVIPLLKERFALYYVHVYALEGTTLTLRAGYGEPGRLMLEQEHSIPLDWEASLVATAARTKQVVHVPDVTTNPNFMPNPLLPDTKTEVAVPLVVGGEVLGVFDIQHDIPNYFNESYLNVFTTLTGQIATALQNARVVEETERQRALYDSILKNLPVGVWAVDQQFNVLLVNDAGRAMMGREIKDKDGGAYTEAYDVVNLQTHEIYDNTQLPLVKTVTQGGAYTITNAGVRWPDGTIVPMLINSGPLLDPQGQRVGGVVIFADATEQQRAQREIERLLQQTSVRLEVSQALAEDLSEEEVLDILIRQTGVFPDARVTLNLLDPEAKELTIVLVRAEAFQSGFEAQIPLGMRFTSKTMPMLQLVGPDKSFISPNLSADDRVHAMVKELMARQGVTSMAVIPMTVGTDWLGVITVAAGKENYFDEHKLHTYQTLAEQGANALRVARLRGGVRRSLAQTNARLRASQELASTQTEEQVLNAIIRVSNFYPEAQIGIFTLEGQADSMAVEVRRIESFESKLAETVKPGMRFAASEFPLVQLVADGQIFISGDLLIDERVDSTSRETARQLGEHSMAAIPMNIGNEQLGFLTIGSAKTNFFDERKMFLYESLAEQSAVALRAARLRAELQASVARFEGFANNTAYGFGMADMEGNILYANPALCQMLHEDNAQAMIGQAIAKNVPEDLNDLFQNQVMPDLTKKGRWSGELAMLAKNGQRIPTYENYFLIRDEAGQPRYIADIITDITERKAAEAERARLSAVLEATSDFVGIAAMDGRGLYFNRSGREMIGIPLEADPGDYNIAMLTPEREMPRTMNEILPMVLKDGHWSGESVVKALDGHEFPVLMSIIAIKDEAGNPLYTANVSRDISDIRAAEAERARLSAVLEATSDFVGIAAMDGRGLYFNRSAREMVGIPLEADPGDYNIAMLSPEREIPRTMNEILPTVIRDGHWSGESVVKALDGHEFPVLMSIIAIKDEAGNPLYTANVSRDISDRKRAEVERERFTTQLSTAAEIAQSVGAILDTDELLETVIPLLKERFGLYHTHVYVLDTEMQVLRLRSGYGQVGKIMQQQGHKITLDNERSLVARAARTKVAVISNNVTQDPDFMPNLLLPETQSEVAVPFMIGEEVLGVFDVQAAQTDFFTEADLDVFRTLAGQIANAFQSARLFEQQRQAQVAQSEAAERIRAIFEAMTEGITVSNTLGQIEDMNEATLRLHRYADRSELLGRSQMELFARNDWANASRGIRQALEKGRSETAEYKMLCKDGANFDAEQNSALLRDADGNPAGFVSITRDITERKRAEEALQLTRASVDETDAEIFWFGDDGNFTDVNDTACDMLGYARKELLKMGIFDIDKDFPHDALFKILAEVREKGKVTLTSSHHTKKGQVIPVEITFYSVEFGKQRHYFLFARDITDRLRAEMERERFTMQLRTAAEVSMQVGAILDPQKLLELVVPLIAERFDLYHVHVYTVDEEAQTMVMRVGSGEIGRLMREQTHAIPLDREQSLVARVARTQKAILVNDVTQESDFMPNPLLPDTRSELAVPLIVGEQVLGVLDVQDDEVQRFTENDMDVFTTLAGQIAAAFLTATSYRRVLEVDRLKGEFLANMSHELRTPLNSILGYTEVMLMGIDGDLTTEMTEDVQAIFENGQQLLRLINDILDLTKIEAGRMVLTLEPVDVLPILEDSKVNNQGLLLKRKTNVEIVIEADKNLPTIIADRVRLGQILNNLVSNAVKFTEKGYIYLRAFSAEDYVYIEVEDTGMGISKEDQAKIFQRFRQVDGSSTRRAEGTGLGLAISRSLVQMHGWELKLTSETEKGSKFSIEIPLKDIPDETTL